MSESSNIIHKSQEITLDRILVDHRSISKKMWDSFQNPNIPFIYACFAAPFVIYSPAWFLLAAFIFYILQLAVTTKDDVLPIHLPLGAGKPDKNDPRPGNKKGWFIARGSFYLGICRRTGMELWANFKALTQHFLVFGTTGAGKTENIVSMIVNYLAVGSGASMNDAKAAPKAMFQLATFCRIFSRDFDFRVTNYIKSQDPNKQDPASRSSNDAGIFARGTPDSNTQLLVSLMPPSGGDNKIFSERAIALVASIMPGMNDLRNLGKLQIDPAVIRRFMGFKEFVGLCHHNLISKSSRDALMGYLTSLSGYDEKKPIGEQNDEVTRQFGFAQAYFTRALASLSDTYGHIYLTGQGEIDYQDAVLNGRILLTLLPSMSKSGDELANLGKIVLTATRNGMVVGLGTVFEGSAEKVVHNLPTNSDIPYGIMNDENAYMLIEGQEMINAQARGLGFGVLTGTQDAPGMLLNIEKTTKQIMANSAFKLFMYLDDDDTTKLACELSGEARVLARNGYKHDGSLNQVYASDHISVEKQFRLTPTAIKSQQMGQGYLLYQGKIHETQVFNHGIQEKHSDPKLCYLKHWWPVRMAKVHIPSQDELAKLLRIDPRPDWIELGEMINDDSRSLLREMKIYFSSMIAIRDIQRRVAENPEMAAFMQSTMGSEVAVEDGASLSNIDQQQEVLSGQLSAIARTSLLTPADVILMIRKITDENDGPSRQIRAAAKQSGIGDFLSDNAGIDFDALEIDNDDNTSGVSGGTGGGGGQGMRASSEPQDMGALLDGYLDDDGTDSLQIDHQFDQQFAPGPPPDHFAESYHDFDDMADEFPSDFSANAQKSEMALLVEQNLVLMPWMANVVDYTATRNDLIETESYFNGDDDFAAAESVDAGLDILASKMTYPTTPMGEASPPNLKLIRSLLNNPR
ncbi:ATP-binding protein [Pseudomonas sp. UMAB-40]|uniref:ATP-binding protein n=1 Tax=Pseudomonas sp. UMAB-40 TaxID=1365407 RepID=UPI001C559DC2|nr:ATP-binding protein [Pseudomonas sp. UMAB-40]